MFTAKTIAAILAAASVVVAAPQYQGSSPSCPDSGSKYPTGTGNNGYPYTNSTGPSTTTDPGSLSTGYPSTGTGSGSGNGNSPSKVAPVDPAVVTHRVTAGFNGLNFEPNNVVANIGDIVEFKFLPKNHSVAQSSFDKPCEPLTDASGAQTGFFAGFDFVTDNGKLADDVFQIVIKDTKPIWYYCPQADHCQKKMGGVINRNFNDNDKTLDKYLAAAALTTQTIIPSTIQGGQEFLNPNPNAGFP